MKFEGFRNARATFHSFIVISNAYLCQPASQTKSQNTRQTAQQHISFALLITHEVNSISLKEATACKTCLINYDF